MKISQEKVSQFPTSSLPNTARWLLPPDVQNESPIESIDGTCEYTPLKTNMTLENPHFQ